MPWMQPRLVLLTILNAKFDNFLAVVGLVCSSFVTISSGTHCRAPWNPLGNLSIPFVAAGNELTPRFQVSKWCICCQAFWSYIDRSCACNIVCGSKPCSTNHVHVAAPCPPQVNATSDGHNGLRRSLGCRTACIVTAPLASKGAGVVEDGSKGRPLVETFNEEDNIKGYIMRNQLCWILHQREITALFFYEKGEVQSTMICDINSS